MGGQQPAPSRKQPVILAGLAPLAFLLAPAPVPTASPPANYGMFAAVGPSRAATPLPMLPGATPATDLAASRLDARLLNAAAPFSAAPGMSARPFLFRGGGLDHARAMDCLAAAVWYEAGDDLVGQRAVAQVVLNRMRHPAFPRTVCGVVFQGSERRTGCQFTFSCDGAMARRPSAAAWRRAQGAAAAALAGRTDPTVGHATHYHTDWVYPAWSPRLNKVARVGTHLFFRWPGRWGTAAAFTNEHGGAEPAVAKMAALSPVHGVATTPFAPVTVAVAPAALAPLEPPPAPPPPPAPERLASRAELPDPDTFLVTLAPGDPDAFLSLALGACGARSHCRFVGWTDARRAAQRMPMSGAAIDAISFMYLRIGGGERNGARWNCAEFRRADAAQCLRRQTG